MMGDYTEHLISMAGGDGDDGLDLDAIQRRIPYIPEDEMSQAERDRKHLFAYARDLEARIGLVEALADQWRGQFAGSPTHLGAAIQQCINSIDNALESSLTATEGAA